MWTDFLTYVAVGFAAQMVDGAIGMAYGITSTTALLGVGVTPVTASACVHAAEVFTTAASGASHWKLGNVDRKLVARLAIPGMIGGCLGAYTLASVEGSVIRPYISLYLLALGVLIICRALRPLEPARKFSNRTTPLGFFGGLLDAIGGGGWGAIVTTTLLGQGADPRTTIGSVNCAEFFVTVVISSTLLVAVGMSLWPIVAGLIIGGVIAAPFAALAAKHLPARTLMALVGGTVTLLSARSLWLLFAK